MRQHYRKVYDIPNSGFLVEQSMPSEVISKLQKVQQQYSTHQPCQRHAKVLAQVHKFRPSLHRAELRRVILRSLIRRVALGMWIVIRE